MTDKTKTKSKPNAALPALPAERIYDIARAIALREWHTADTVTTDVDNYFAQNRDRLLREAEAFAVEFDKR